MGLLRLGRLPFANLIAHVLSDSPKAMESILAASEGARGSPRCCSALFIRAIFVARQSVVNDNERQES
jgi:hypothetical protein